MAWSDFGWLLTSIAAFIGAFLSPFAKEVVSFIRSTATKIESERDVDFEIMCDVLNEVKELAVVHWGLPESDEGAIERRGKIISRLHFISKVNTDFSSSDIELKRSIDIHLMGFRKETSGGQFGESNRTPFEGKAMDIEIAYFDILREIKNARRALKSKFWN